MSLTNPNTVVTEERLNDFYKGILPYMGGMPEMVANKFSKGDLYSTDEKMIGQWIDGKPLYQRTVVINNPLNNWDTIQSYGIENIEHVISVNDRYWMDNNAWEGSQYYKTTDNITAIFLRPGFRLSCVGATPSKVILTIQYTKTTDSAISIGNDTDYSTEEKVVGTWIDKPLYQRTYATPFPQVSTYGTLVSTVIDSDTTKRVKNVYGSFEVADGNQAVTIPFYGWDADKMIQISVKEDSGGIKLRSNHNAYNSCTAYITIQYTKTTD